MTLGQDLLHDLHQDGLSGTALLDDEGVGALHLSSAAIEQAALVLAEIDLVHHLLDVTAIGADQVDDLLPVLLAAALENVAEGIQQHIVAGVAAVGLVAQEQGCPLLVGHSGGTGVRQHIHSQHAGGERKLIPVRSVQSALALFNGSLRKIAHHICAVLRHRHIQGIVLRILVHFVYLHNLAFSACFFGDTPVVEGQASLSCSAPGGQYPIQKNRGAARFRLPEQNAKQGSCLRPIPVVRLFYHVFRTPSTFIVIFLHIFDIFYAV